MPREKKKVISPPETEPKSRLSGEERREQLIQTAIRLFSQNGFRGTTTREIARAAGVTEALVFQHFANKDELYAAILDSKANEVVADEFIEELRQHAARRDDEALFRALAAKTLEYYRKNTDFLRLMLYSALEAHEMAQEFRAKRTQQMNKFLCDYVSQRQREGAFGRRNPQAVVHAYLSQLNYHALLTMLFGADALQLTDKQAVEHFTGLFLSGMRNGAANGHSVATKARSKKQK